MAFTLWRLPVVALGLLGALLFVYTGAVIEGVVTGSVAVLWFADRARIPESVGVRFLHHRAYLELAKILTLAVLALASTACLVVALVLRWNRDPEGPILFAALAGCAVLLTRELERRYSVFENYMDGGNAEVMVSNELHTLPADWVVEDNWLRDDGRGNVDHIVGRPDGAWFAIETKSGRFRHAALSQAVGGAVALQRARGLSWVTPILCVGDLEQKAELRTIGRAKVWVVGRHGLIELLKTVQSTALR